MSPLRIQLDRIRRRGWLVLTITLLATLGALAATLGQQTTYTGRATLTIISQDRAPEQDAPLAQGYAEYFNEKSYQEVLRQGAGVPAGLLFAARTAATSPIVYVEATASNPELAASAASAMARQFLTNVNANLLADRESKIAELRNQITAERALLMTLPESSPEASLSSNTVLSLQSRVSELQADTSSQLRELQLNAGVAEITPKYLQNTALGLIGGLVLGCVVALAFAGVENRLATAHEVRDQLNLDTLAIIPGGRSRAADGVRAQRFKRLANVVSLGDLHRPATLAITSPRATAGTARVAEALAYYRAFQGERTLHMCADLHPQRARQRAEHEGWPGVADALASPYRTGLDGKIIPGWCSTMRVMPTGSAGEDPYALFGRDRFADLVQRATGIADLVVIEAPPIIEAAEGQVICATADRTILVIEEDATRAGDAIEACQLLEQVEATVLGVVIIGSPAIRAHQPNEEPPDRPIAPPGSPTTAALPMPPAPPPPPAPPASDPWPPAGPPTLESISPIVAATFEDGRPGARP